MNILVSLILAVILATAIAREGDKEASTVSALTMTAMIIAFIVEMSRVMIFIINVSFPS